MRPVDKGSSSPYEKNKVYQDALTYLEERIGLYCSYCEMPIKHVPEVEHIVAKSRGGDLTAWSNLLLACKYCNTRKLAEVTPETKEDYLWSDEYNTAIGYTYYNGFPQINESELRKLDITGEIYKKAKNLYDLVSLDHIKDKNEKKKTRDRRFIERTATYYRAIDSLEGWQESKSAPKPFRENLKKQIVMTVGAEGFFSVWLTVFSEEPEICNALIESFPGTRKECYDESGTPQKMILEMKKDDDAL